MVQVERSASHSQEAQHDNNAGAHNESPATTLSNKLKEIMSDSYGRRIADLRREQNQIYLVCCPFILAIKHF